MVGGGGGGWEDNNSVDEGFDRGRNVVGECGRRAVG